MINESYFQTKSKCTSIPYKINKKFPRCFVKVVGNNKNNLILEYKFADQLTMSKYEILINCSQLIILIDRVLSP